MRKLAFILLLLIACQKPESNPVPNSPPETFLFVDTIRDPIASKQVFHWYGNDKDGEVVGFYIAKDDTSNKSFTTKYSDTLYFEADSLPTPHLFCVWAVDNEQAVDPTPACINFLSKNTPPTIAFQSGTLPPETTLSIATFFLDMYDPDGNATLGGFMYRLDTDTAWNIVPKDSLGNLITEITLTNIPPGLRTVFFRAFDEAGGVSDSISYTWFVLPVNGNILLLDDDPGYSGTFYEDALSAYLLTRWNIDNNFPYAFRDFNLSINSLGFTTIIWFTSDAQSHLSYALNALVEFLNSGGKLIVFSPQFVNATYDTIYGVYHPLLTDYSGVDSVVYSDKPFINNPLFNRMKAVSTTYPSPLEMTQPLINGGDGVLLNASATLMYELEDTLCNSFNWRYNPSTGNCDLPVPIIGWKKGKFYVFTFPLHYFNANANAQQLLIQIINE